MSTATGTSPGSEHSVLRSDPRLASYLVVGLATLLFATVTGQASLATLGAPFLVLAVWGLTRPPPGGLKGHVELAAQRAIEESDIEGEIHVDWEGEAEVDVILAGARGVRPVDPEPATAWSLPLGRGPVVLPFKVRAAHWGSHDLGSVWIRARSPGGMVFREQRVATTQTLRVLPTPLRLARLLQPIEPHAVSGTHLSRLRGQGTDLAELRPYQPGDRLRDLSWATSARLGAPWVRVQHPERTGAVLLLLDSFLTDDQVSMEGLARAARAAWAVASVHLRVQDRVGLLAWGGTSVWVPPAGGNRARYLLLDQLLSVGRAAHEGRKRRYSGRIVVPPDALVVGITSLRSKDFTLRLTHYRRHGHATAALVVDASDILFRFDSAADRAAQRMWVAKREILRHSLDRSGIPTALVTPTQGVGAAVSSLRRRMAAVRRGGVSLQPVRGAS